MSGAMDVGWAHNVICQEVRDLHGHLRALVWLFLKVPEQGLSGFLLPPVLAEDCPV